MTHMRTTFVHLVSVVGDMNKDQKKIKSILASVLNMKPDEIKNDTIIIPQSSIQFHKMRSALKEFKDIDFESAETFGDLIGLKSLNMPSKASPKDVFSNSNTCSIGIDIESVKNFHDANDYHAESFYLDNFSKKEIIFCSRQDLPTRCFAGRFAAKEAIYKAMNGYCGRDFNKIEVKTNSDGSVDSEFCYISISYLFHDDIEIASAVALSKSCLHEKNKIDKLIDKNIERIEDIEKNFTTFKKNSAMAFLTILSIIGILQFF